MELFEHSRLFESKVSVHCSRLKLVILFVELVFVEGPWRCNCGGVGKPEEAEELNLLEDRLQGASDTVDGEDGDTLAGFVE